MAEEQKPAMEIGAAAAVSETMEEKVLRLENRIRELETLLDGERTARAALEAQLASSRLVATVLHTAAAAESAPPTDAAPPAAVSPAASPLLGDAGAESESAFSRARARVESFTKTSIEAAKAGLEKARDRIVAAASEQTTRLDHMIEAKVTPRVQSVKSSLPDAVHSAVGLAQEKLKQMTQTADMLSRRLEAFAGPRIESMQQRMHAFLSPAASAPTDAPAGGSAAAAAASATGAGAETKPSEPASDAVAPGGDKSTAAEEEEPIRL